MNPWLGYSPDGIIFENNLPSKLIGIKCPYLSKTRNINIAIENIDYIVKDRNNNIVLKERHTYYNADNGDEYDNIFSAQKFEKKLLAHFDEDIDIVKMGRKNYIVPKNFIIEENICDILEEKEILHNT
ncbi:hypothetical protein PV326_002163 [Microctonus aethiopoides]|uniref:YqaJ viral recombinase domain-containing protein n=1 Tax=Microctonus aethiopoides TaxID=144406 RepID=A0AA39ETN6_9HYME|nr:hypothetical protein PV326_002163 [Microctonus aethiopoides]KAK0156704.1 hypothetical protein PV328_012415 [Microctonus aethiopoides]